MKIEQIIFIVVVSVIVLVGLFLLIFFLVRKTTKRKRFFDYNYRKVYSIAFAQDYYLINRFHFRESDRVVATIDHILFGDKFIYLISGLFYPGYLSGDYDDKSLVFTSYNGARSYTDNPFVDSERIVAQLAGLTDIDQSIFIGVVLVNDDCKLDVKSNSKQFFITQRRHLPGLVKSIENRDVGKLNPEQLDRAVKGLAKINKKAKNSK